MTLDEFLKHDPCWIGRPYYDTRLYDIASRHKDWSVEQVIGLYPRSIDNISDVMWAACVVAGKERTVKAYTCLLKRISPEDTWHQELLDPLAHNYVGWYAFLTLLRHAQHVTSLAYSTLLKEAFKG